MKILDNVDVKSINGGGNSNPLAIFGAWWRGFSEVVLGNGGSSTGIVCDEDNECTMP